MLKERVIKYFFGIGAVIAPILVILILGHILTEAWPAISKIGAGLIDIGGKWQPLAGSPSYSFLPMLLATLYVAFLAVLLALATGLGASLFFCFYASDGVRSMFLSLTNSLAGIPSVIFGFLGLVILVKKFEQLFSMPSGECVFAAAVLLSVMLWPFVVSACSDSIQSAKGKYMQTALASGLSREYTIRKIIVPASRLGVLSALVMALGRALGETMAVMMVIGNAPILPRLFGRAETIAGLTALEMGSVEYGSLHLSALYAANLALLVLLGLIYLAAYLLRRKMRKSA